MSVLMNTYKRLAVSFVRGQGPYLWDAKNIRYLDFLSGIAVMSLGHSHSKITDAICKQAQKIMHVSNGFNIPEQTQLAKKLAAISGLDQAFFCNSGAEAVEAALKLTRLYARQQNIKMPKVVTVHGGFHGRTLACISAADNPPIKQGFEPFLADFVHVPFNQIKPMEALSGDPDIVAVMLEPVMGEGGVLVPDRDYLRHVRQLCTKNHWLMICDEIQCGLARTGHWFAYQHAKIQPDILLLAKALGNGYPIGACVARQSVGDLFTPGAHGSTFGGNPMACHIACTVIDIIEQEGILEQVKQVSAYLMDSLRDLKNRYAGVVDVRGQGLMIGFELEDSCGPIRQIGLDHQILFSVTQKKVIRILPPLIINSSHVDQFIEQLDHTLAQYFDG